LLERICWKKWINNEINLTWLTLSSSPSTRSFHLFISLFQARWTKPIKLEQICSGGVYCLELKDKEHSTQFIHLNPVNFSFLSFTHTLSFDLIWFDFSFHRW
jgi:hypothetical protein